MWKLIKGSYTAGRELFRILGEGKELLEDGLKNLNKGMEAIDFELKSVSNELRETLCFKKDIHQLNLCRLVIIKNQKRTPLNCPNLLHFFDLSNSMIDHLIDLFQLAIDNPSIRSFVKDFTEKLKSEFNSSIDKDEEWKLEVTQMRSNGLNIKHSMLEVFDHYLEFTPLDELEKKVKPELPNIINGYKSIHQLYKQLVQATK